MKNEATAKQILDRVENYLSTDLKTRDAIMNSINKAWNITDDSLALRYKNYRNALDNSKFGSGVVGFITAGGNVLISNVSGEDTVETVIGLGVDVALTLMELTPAGRVINIALTLTGFDPATKLKDIYRSLAYESEVDYNNNKIAKLVGAKSVTIEKNILKVTMSDGTVYARPLSSSFFPYGVTPSGLLTGGNGYTNDVLFGGYGDDTLMGKNGSDLLIGGAGHDTYNATYGDIIRDSDGKGEVYFKGHKLTGGTYDEDKGVYVSKDYIEYKLQGNKLIVSNLADTITIENYDREQNSLGIYLLDKKDIIVTISDESKAEGDTASQSMKFTIKLNRKLEKDEYLNLLVWEGNGKSETVSFKENQDEATYTYTWSGDKIPQEDKKFKISASVRSSSDNINVKGVLGGNGVIENDDDPDSPNDTFPDTDPASTKTSPIVIDLNNDGVKTISRKDNKIYFDLDNNKFAQNSAWIDKNDGILINKTLITDNNITNGSQLFGNHTLLTNGNLATNGFEALKEFVNLNLLVA